MHSQPAIFLDRDGTIIHETHYIKDPEKVALIDGVVDALKLMRSKGYLLFVVSNQAGVGRGLITDDEFLAVHKRVCEQLQAHSVDIAQFLYCFHHPDEGCGCRKPKAGLIPKSFEGVNLDFSRSYTIGDRECDIQLASEIGAKGCLVLTGYGEQTSKALQEKGNGSCPVFKNLIEFANFIS